MASLRDTLKDHPIQSILTGLASIATILGFIFLLKSESCNNTNKTILPNDSNDTGNIEAKEKFDKNLKENHDSDLSKTKIEEKNINGIVSHLDTSYSVSNQDFNNNGELKETKKENKKEDESKITSKIDLNEKYVCSLDPNNDDQLYFYDRKGNTYKFIGNYSIYDFNGTAIQQGNILYLNGNYGKGQLEITNHNKFAVGYIQGGSWDVTINAEIKNKK